MNLWLGAMVALLCALAGAALGRWFSRRRHPYWMMGYFIPLGLVAAYALTHFFPGLRFAPPLAWLFWGIRKFAVLGFIITLILGTPLSRVPLKRNRIMIAILTGFMVFMAAIWPFLAPLASRRELSRLQTNMDRNGICLQTTDYTCGPAAAVTALRRLGLPADEGQLAILTCTSGLEGTPEDMLAEGLNRHYGAQGLSATCRAFKSIAELKQAGLTLAVIKYGNFVDHWVTVLEVTDSEVVVGDPLGGLSRLSYSEFAEKWRFIGVVIRRERTAPGV